MGPVDDEEIENAIAHAFYRDSPALIAPCIVVASTHTRRSPQCGVVGSRELVCPCSRSFFWLLRRSPPSSAFGRLSGPGPVRSLIARSNPRRRGLNAAAIW